MLCSVEGRGKGLYSGPQKHISISTSTLLGFILRGFIWDIPSLILAYVLFWGPILGHQGVRI